MHANLIAPIPGSEGYFATRSGKILSTRFGKVKALKDAEIRKGYRCVVLWRDKAQKTYQVHRLVLSAFDGQPKDGQVCMHLNNDPSDNRSSNLRWGTPKENSQQMVRDGRGQKPVKLSAEAVQEIRKSMAGNAELAARFGIDKSYVSHIRAGRKRA